MKLPSFLFRLMFNESLDYRYEIKVLIFWLLGMAFSVIFVLLFTIPFAMVGAAAWQHIAYIQGIIVGFFFATFVCWLILSKEREIEVSTGLLDWKWLKSLKGFAVGSTVLLLFSSVGYVFNWFSFELNSEQISTVSFPLNALFACIFFSCAAMAEELMFRGFPLQINGKPEDRMYRITFLSVIFCLMHGFNDHISWLGFINLFIAGVWLSYGALAERTVWYSFGLHLGWNLLQAFVFNFPNSGEVFFSHIYIIQVELSPYVSEFFTGGKFGPEGSILATGLLILAAWYEKRRLEQ